MTLVYNIQPFTENWIFTQGETINFPKTVILNSVAYDMTGMTVDVWIRRLDGLVIKKFTTSGIAPTITILVNVFTIYDTGFLESGLFEYDVKVTNLASDILVIGRGYCYVNERVTV